MLGIQMIDDEFFIQLRMIRKRHNRRDIQLYAIPNKAYFQCLWVILVTLAFNLPNPALAVLYLSKGPET